MTDIATLLQQATQAKPRAIERIEAEFLIAHVLAKPRSWLYAFSDTTLNAAQQTAFHDALARRLAGEPIAYITGRRGFWSFELQVTPDTLIPRPETELLVELALACLHPAQNATVLDLGTGSGAVALAIASERPLAQVTAVDYSADALAVAIGNARQLKLANTQFLQGDWFAPVAGQRFELIVSNPPYIETGDAHLQQGDLRFEPSAALAAGADGLADLRQIVAQAPLHLQAGGWLLVEHGYAQGAAVRELFAQASFSEISTERDLENRERVTLGKLPA
jgi:release factor glutamine methyltransferase